MLARLCPDMVARAARTAPGPDEGVGCVVLSGRRLSGICREVCGLFVFYCFRVENVPSPFMTMISLMGNRLW